MWCEFTHHVLCFSSTTLALVAGKCPSICSYCFALLRPRAQALWGRRGIQSTWVVSILDYSYLHASQHASQPLATAFSHRSLRLQVSNQHQDSRLTYRPTRPLTTKTLLLAAQRLFLRCMVLVFGVGGDLAPLPPVDCCAIRLRMACMEGVIGERSSLRRSLIMPGDVR